MSNNFADRDADKDTGLVGAKKTSFREAEGSSSLPTGFCAFDRSALVAAPEDVSRLETERGCVLVDAEESNMPLL